MVDRLTVDEFFDALRDQRVYPLVDTPTARKVVQAVARAYGSDYPIKDRWPVLDLESAYEGHVNAHVNLIEFHKNGYSGTVSLRGFDERYTLDEWFDDFRSQWALVDDQHTRQKMLRLLPTGDKWLSSELYGAHENSVKGTLKGLVRKLKRPR
jgi:hypothetical protein